MVTIILPVSRDYFLKRIFAQLEMLDCDATQTNLLTYVDGDLELFQKTRNMTVNSKFAERLCVFRKRGLPNVGSIRRRRQRIADIHNEMSLLIAECDYIFMLEDDTLFPVNALKNLLKSYAENPFAGFISGIEIGRWGFDHIGAWKVDDIYHPAKITSVPLHESSLIDVDAAGFYCALTKKETYIKHNFQPFQDILGPDVDFGIELRKQGLKNYIDYNIKCSHLTKRGAIEFGKTEVIQVQFTKQNKVWDLKNL